MFVLKLSVLTELKFQPFKQKFTSKHNDSCYVLGLAICFSQCAIRIDVNQVIENVLASDKYSSITSNQGG